MKKIIAYAVLLIFLTIYIVSLNPYLTRKLAGLKYQTENTLLRSEKYRYGDLFGISFLSNFKIPTKLSEPLAVGDGVKNINLYALGDSYIADKIQTKNFIGVDSLFFCDWKDSSKNLQLNHSKKNVLVIETTERTFLYKFSDDKKLKFPFIPGYENFSSLRNKGIGEYLFDKQINDNLEFAMFDNPWFTYAKQLRADINYSLFNKLPPVVIVSDDGKNIFLTSTVDSNFIMPTESSSFKTISDSILQNCIKNCNLLRHYYINLGFSDVYISIIPNPVSVYGFSSYRYNNLLPRIEGSSSRNFKTINVYPYFKINRDKVYLRADTHWSSYGLQYWINTVNFQLAHSG